ncbi:hypothetical protein P0Y35_16155 [Kiritimatiellaeota bacterium B1221]|nr:hypothetical protein [Kiritimatiellaeota bacterium B1221]
MSDDISEKYNFYRKEIEKTNKRNRIADILFWIVAGSSLFAYIANPFISNFLLSQYGNTEAGLPRMAFLGDSFGTVTAFYSALAFILIFYSIILTRKDISLQKEMMLMQMEDIQVQQNQNKIMSVISSAPFLFEKYEREIKLNIIYQIFESLYSNASKDYEIKRPYFQSIQNDNDVCEIHELYTKFDNKERSGELIYKYLNSKCKDFDSLFDMFSDKSKTRKTKFLYYEAKSFCEMHINHERLKTTMNMTVNDYCKNTDLHYDRITKKNKTTLYYK